MKAKFCPKCGSILTVKSKNHLKCSCGYNAEAGVMILKETLDAREIEVMEDDSAILAVYDHKCSKCGHGKAQLIEKGVWYSDEDNVVAYKCGKCGHTEMDVDKIT